MIIGPGLLFSVIDSSTVWMKRSPGNENGSSPRSSIVRMRSLKHSGWLLWISVDFAESGLST